MSCHGVRHHLSFRSHSLRFHWSRSPGEVHCFDRSLVSDGYIPVDPCFVNNNVATQKHEQIALKQRQTLLLIVSRLRLLSGLSKRGTHRADNFSCPVFHAGLLRCLRSQPLHTFKRQSTNTRSRTFLTLSSVVGSPVRGSSKIDVRPL